MMDWMRGAVGRLAPGLSSFYPGESTGRLEQIRQASIAGQAAKPADLYAMLRAYYAQNALYARLARGLYEAGINAPAMAGLRNPAFRVVEFYVAALWPGQLPDALPIEADNERIIEPIQRVWTWSNWGSQKQVVARWLPMLGDVFLKVAQNAARDRVYFQLVDPAHVVDFDTDERGYLTYCRIDVPIQRRQRDLLRALTHTEVWSRDAGTFRRWEHDQGDRPVEELGAPLEETPLAAFGIDFVPIVHCQFRDVGEARGVGAYTLALDKIDEAARKATRLGQQLFRHNNNTWVLEATAMDKEGRPLPPLKVGADGAAALGVGSVQVGGDTMMSLPGGYSAKSVVPALDYVAMLAALNADLLELQQDLPEMAYWRIPEASGEPSGRALRLLLAPALSRADEARGNAFDALARADAMALTIGQAAGLFTGLGTYEAGDFEHTFEEQDVIPINELEQSQADVQSWTAAKLQKDAGVTTEQVLRERGYDDQQIAEMAQQREADQSALNEALGTLLDRQPGARVTVGANGAPPNGQPPPAQPPPNGAQR